MTKIGLAQSFLAVHWNSPDSPDFLDFPDFPGVAGCGVDPALSELSAHQMAHSGVARTSGVAPHWRSRPALEPIRAERSSNGSSRPSPHPGLQIHIQQSLWSWFPVFFDVGFSHHSDAQVSNRITSVKPVAIVRIVDKVLGNTISQ